MDVMEYDVLIVGAGPSGLASAIQLKTLGEAQGKALSVCVLEKGAEVGAHIISGAVLEPRALDELIPDWRDQSPDFGHPVTQDDFYWLKNTDDKLRIPHMLLPRELDNTGNWVISLGALCQMLASHAENLGVEIFTGFTADSIAFDEHGAVDGIITGEMGLNEDGSESPNYVPAIHIKSKQTLFCEGARGHLGKQLIRHFELDKGKDPNHFALGFKEIWKISKDKHVPGKTEHAIGWPLNQKANGGAFCYHYGDNLVSLGLVIDLDYSNPSLQPFMEFQSLKHHAWLSDLLEDAERISYGARAINKSGFHALPAMSFDGGFLLGCDAGTLNVAKIKGTHTAMKSGMLAAQSIIESWEKTEQDKSQCFTQLFESSWLHQELYASRNLIPSIKKWGSWAGGAVQTIESRLFKGNAPWQLHHQSEDAKSLQTLSTVEPYTYLKPDGKLSFDRLSSVYLANLSHRDDQPNHLKLEDATIPISTNLRLFGEPAQFYCPAGVYEVEFSKDSEPAFRINSQNCIHCKTCDIKDPSENITWTPPEGASGPNYSGM
ncbi:electron-transferring-flavoprotein dehydrogenase [Vibrio nigripulchritudo]|nr:electron-transferring-flavoprotein dehydrogenase [Vibrio nigripulchritudo]BDU33439.1 electron-transferring-flavoprotein dehydrogenase [Vibrio nigripulchritudo]